MNKTLLKMAHNVADSISNLYKEAQSESIVAIYLKRYPDFYLAESFNTLPESAYRLKTHTSSNIHGQYVKKIISHCSEQQYAGFLLMHNHLINIPYASLSSTDKMTHKKVEDYLDKHHPDVLYGTAVYVRERCSVWFNDSVTRIRNKSLKKMIL